MRKIALIALFLSSLLSLRAQENIQEGLAISLDEAIKIAKQNNIDLKDKQLDVAIAETQVDQVKAQGLPQVNGSFNYTRTLLNAFSERTSGDNSAPLPPLDASQFQQFNQNQLNEIQNASAITTGTFFSGLGDAFASKHAATVAGSVKQQLFNGVYLLGLKAAEVYVDLSRVQATPSERDIEKAVEKAYYGALITHENINIIDKNIKNIEQLRYETAEIYKAGFAEQLDIDRLDLSLSTLAIQRKSLEQIKELNYDLLKNQLSIPLSTEIELTEDIDLFEKEATSDEIVASIATPEAWPEFQIFDIQEKIGKLDIERIDKGKYPTVDAFVNGNYGYQGNNFIFSDKWYPNLTAGIDIGINIFDGNLRKNQIKQKRLELDKIQLSRESLQQRIDLAIENSQTQYLNYRRELNSNIENIKLAEKIYDTAKIKYKEGVGSSIELNQAEQSLYQAQQNYITTLYNLLIAKVDLEQAIGK